MPNIEEFNAGSGQLDPSNRGTEAAVQEGRRVGSFYHQIGEGIGGAISEVGGQYEKHQTQQEMLRLYSSGTDLENNIRQAWQAYASKPENANRPDLASSFMDEQVTPIVNSWQSFAKTDSGQRFAAEYGARIRQNMFEHTAAEQSSIDAEAAIQHGKDAMNSLSAGIANDPGGNHDAAIGTMKDVATALASSIPDPVTRAKVEGELTAQAQAQGAVAHYLGLINSGQPGIDQARKDMDAGRYGAYLSPEQTEALRSRADSAERQIVEKASAAQVAFRKQQEDDGHAVYAQLVSGMVDPKTGAPIPPTPETLQAYREFADKYGRYLPAEVASLGSSMHTSLEASINRTYTQSDPGTFASLSARVGSTSAPLTHAEVDAAHAQGRLSERDWHDLHESVERSVNDPSEKLLSQAKTQFFASVKAQFGQLDMFGNLKGQDAARFYEYQMYVEGAIAAAKRGHDGKTASPQAIIDTMLNPNSANYLLGPHQMPYFMKYTKGGLSQAAGAAALRATKAGTPAASAAAAPDDNTAGDQGAVRVNVAPQVSTAAQAAAIQTAPRQANETPEQYLSRIGR